LNASGCLDEVLDSLFGGTCIIVPLVI